MRVDEIIEEVKDTTPSRRRVFIIHGRDTAACQELGKLIASLGLDVLSFEDAANAQGPSPLINQAVLNGIKEADAVIALFTPDEHVAFYDLNDGRLDTGRDNEPGWQARANVLFEAGIALGTRASKAILATLGKDVRVSSDLRGYHTLELASPRGKESLRKRLEGVLGPLPVPEGWQASADSGDFQSLVQPRWSYYDEVESLMHSLANRSVPAPKPRGGASETPVTLLEILSNALGSAKQKGKSLAGPHDVLLEINARYSNSVTEEAYWWLVTLGVFQFNNIENWGIDSHEGWRKSVVWTQFCGRTTALFGRLSCRGLDPERRQPSAD